MGKPSGKFEGMAIVAVPISQFPAMQAAWSDTLAFRLGQCKIFVSGPTERAVIGWHLSMSHPHRLPTWDEMNFARIKLLPHDVDFVLPMPRLDDDSYVNTHPFCLHIHEAKMVQSWGGNHGLR